MIKDRRVIQNLRLDVAAHVWISSDQQVYYI